MRLRDISSGVPSCGGGTGSSPRSSPAARSPGSSSTRWPSREDIIKIVNLQPYSYKLPLIKYQPIFLQIIDTGDQAEVEAFVANVFNVRWYI